jgi:DNA-binding NtrC family response regulator
MNQEKMIPVKDIGVEKRPRTILLVTTRSSQMLPFTEELLRETRMQLITVGSADEALDAARRKKIVLAIVDDRIAETAGLDLIKRLIEIDAFMHTAVLSDAGEEDFHNRSEGLGVLARLALMPDQKDARRLCGLLGTMPH